MMSSTDLTLQRIIIPNLTVCSEFELYLRQDGPVTPNPLTQVISFGAGGRLRTNTYMNLFNLANWQRHCDLRALTLGLAGAGDFRLRVLRITAELLDQQVLFDGPVTLSANPARIDLSHALAKDGAVPADGLIAVELSAQGDGELSDARFLSPAPAGIDAGMPDLALAISITTFRREQEVARTAQRVAEFLDGPASDILAAAGARAHLFIVDNGQSAKIAPHPLVTVIPNANLGGAGGFARGLAEAEDAGFTHCLFMDDDASFEMENLVRTIAFLRLARRPKTAVAGSMIVNSRKWAMWENGAVFDRSCRPCHIGTDLRSLVELTTMELKSAGPKPANFYGGWWYFAFPIGEVTYYPFPFFVRGDDISFSLANTFDIATINGVVSFQDDFAGKESALTLYLDLRNHLHHHLAHPDMKLGMLRTLGIFWRFYLRSIIRLHYETAEAQIIALEDVLKGPGFFEANADMMTKRGEILALIDQEKWRPADPEAAVPAKPYSPPSPLRSQWMKFTLNGHINPFHGAGSRRRIMLEDRGLIWPMWGISQAQFVDYDKGLSYEVQFDRSRFMRLTRRAIRTSLAFRKRYAGLCAEYSRTYPETAARSFWQNLFQAQPKA